MLINILKKSYLRRIPFERNFIINSIKNLKYFQDQEENILIECCKLMQFLFFEKDEKVYWKI